MLTPTPRPPWLQPGPFCGIPAAQPRTEHATQQHRRTGYTPADWTVACSVCPGIDGLPRGGTEAELRLHSWESAWVAFDLLATPRSGRVVAGSVPTGDAALLVTDSFRRAWRICWQHNGSRYRALTAVADEGGQAIAVEALPRTWWPLLVRSAHIASTPADPPAETDTAVEHSHQWGCPPWCQLPAEHADWRSTAAGLMTRTHRAVFPLTVGERVVSLVLTVDEHATGHGITWGERDIQVADTATPTPAETTFIHSFARHLGAVLRVAALPLPSRARTVDGVQVVDIPGALCTAAGRDVYRRRLGHMRWLDAGTEVTS